MLAKLTTALHTQHTLRHHPADSATDGNHQRAIYHRILDHAEGLVLYALLLLLLFGERLLANVEPHLATVQPLPEICHVLIAARAHRAQPLRGSVLVIGNLLAVLHV